MTFFEKFKLSDVEIASTTFDSLKDYFKNVILGKNKNEHIVTFNLDFLRTSTLDKNFKQICMNADLVIPDGVGVTSLINRKYKTKIKRITGYDAFKIILEISNEINFKVALVGSTEKIQKKCIERIKKEFSNIEIAASISPPFLFEKNDIENKKVVEELISAKPDVLFVGLGSPRQEFWLKENMKLIGAKINIGIGGVFDFYSGAKIRAPKIFRDYSLEWFWRLINEPKRLYKRYLVDDLPFYFKMLKTINKK
ncbi:MAG: WecB/TagA/CpsF family glycosyltransferase [Ignavibacteriaceae bacterium]